MSRTLFQPQALSHHAQRHNSGDVLRLDKTWAHAAYRLIVAAAISGFVFVSFFSVDEYAQGPAVIHIDGRSVSTATSAGTVQEVSVRPGELVYEGTILVRMHDQDEANELARASQEFEQQVVRMLVDLSSVAAREALPGLRAARDRARIAAESRLVRARSTGRITDIRARAGQHVNAGDVLLALTPQSPDAVSLTAMIPADYRPMLKSGQRLRLELGGFRYQYTDLVVDSVSSEGVGPSEVRRFLGDEGGDAVDLEPGAKVLVSAHIPATTFHAEGRAYEYFDGLTGHAEVCVRRETILVSLLPTIRQWLK